MEKIGKFEDRYLSYFRKYLKYSYSYDGYEYYFFQSFNNLI